MSAGKRQLVEVISALRNDIEAAIDEGDSEKIKFDVNEIEIDLQTQITKTGDVNINGGVEFKILGYEIGKAGGEIKGQYSKADSHTIRLKLKPKRWDDQAKKYKNVEFSDLD